MSRHNRHLEDERLLVQEQIQDYAEQIAGEQANLRRQHEFEALYNAAATSTPAQLHGVLHAFLQAQLMDDTSTYHVGWAAEFFDQLRAGGLDSAVLSNVAKDDADGQERSRTGARNLVPNHAIVWPVMRHVLANPDEYHWQGLEVALKSAETYATDRAEAARLLAEYIREDSAAALSVRQLCPEARALSEVPDTTVDRDAASARLLAQFVRNAPALAALSLSKLAPDTPGLAEVLIDAVGRDWEASARLSFAAGIGGAGMAAEALARLGPRGRQVLHRLREAVLSDRWDWHSTADRRMAFEAYAALCEDDTAVLALLDEVVAKGHLSDEFLAPIVRLAQEKPAFVAVLARLVQSRFWTKRSDYSNKFGWIDTIEFLSARGRDSEVVLPALAAALERPRDESRGPEMDYREHAKKAIRQFLDRLLAGQGAWSPEDAFVVALHGVPSVGDAWRVYADWLADRGDPRGEFLQLRQTLARTGGPDAAGRRGELSQRRDTWLAAHGPGWAVLYDLVSEPVNNGP